MQFKQYLNLEKNLKSQKAIHIPENFSWANDFKLPSLSLDLPKIEKKSKIMIIMDKTNPIYVQLSDGSKLFFTFDEFNRIQGQPKVGKTMSVQMQRLTQDGSQQPSRITSCKVTD